jgi:hypothetical protein
VQLRAVFTYPDRLQFHFDQLCWYVVEKAVGGHEYAVAFEQFKRARFRLFRRVAEKTANVGSLACHLWKQGHLIRCIEVVALFATTVYDAAVAHNAETAVAQIGRVQLTRLFVDHAQTCR